MINCFCYVSVLFLFDGVHVIQPLFLIFGPCQVHRRKIPKPLVNKLCWFKKRCVFSDRHIRYTLRLPALSPVVRVLWISPLFLSSFSGQTGDHSPNVKTFSHPFECRLADYINNNPTQTGKTNKGSAEAEKAG